jgi:hypothetical protein
MELKCQGINIHFMLLTLWCLRKLWLAYFVCMFVVVVVMAAHGAGV